MISQCNSLQASTTLVTGTRWHPWVINLNPSPTSHLVISQGVFPIPISNYKALFPITPQSVQWRMHSLPFPTSSIRRNDLRKQQCSQGTEVSIVAFFFNNSLAVCSDVEEELKVLLASVVVRIHVCLMLDCSQPQLTSPSSAALSSKYALSWLSIDVSPRERRYKCHESRTGTATPVMSLCEGDTLTNGDAKDIDEDKGNSWCQLGMPL